jgi:hypothetical protein
VRGRLARIRKLVNIWGLLMFGVFRLFGLVLQALFGYRFEGAEHVLAEAPFILLPKEGGGQLAMLSISFGFVSAMVRLMADLRDRIVATLHEDLWFRYFSRIKVPAPIHPLRPVSGGMLSMGVLDQLRVLREGGGGSHPSRG